MTRRSFLHEACAVGTAILGMPALGAAALVGGGKSPEFEPFFSRLRSRISLRGPDPLIDSFLNAGPHDIFAFYQHFPPRFLSADPTADLASLRGRCEERLKSTPDKRHLLVILPHLAGIHTVPYLADPQERVGIVEAVAESVERSADPTSSNANREVVEGAFQGLAAFLTNEGAEARFRAGPRLLRAAKTVCIRFLAGEEILLFGALAAWQFILNYQRVLKGVRGEVAVSERDSVNALVKEILSTKERGIWWLRQLWEIHREWGTEYRRPLPQFQELFLNRPDSSTPLLDRAYRFVLLARVAANWTFLEAVDSRPTPFLLPDRARAVATIVYGLLRDARISINWYNARCRDEWGKLIDAGILRREAVGHFVSESLVTKDLVPLENPIGLLLPFSQFAPAAIASRVHPGSATELERVLKDCRDEEMLRNHLEAAAVVGARSVALGNLDDESRVKADLEDLLKRDPDLLRHAVRRIEEDLEVLGPQRTKRGRSPSNPDHVHDGQSENLADESLPEAPRPTQTELNEQAKLLIQEMGMSQSQLAKVTGITQGHFSNILTGNTNVTPALVNHLKLLRDIRRLGEGGEIQKFLGLLRAFPSGQAEPALKLANAFLRRLLDDMTSTKVSMKHN